MVEEPGAVHSSAQDVVRPHLYGRAVSRDPSDHSRTGTGAATPNSGDGRGSWVRELMEGFGTPNSGIRMSPLRGGTSPGNTPQGTQLGMAPPPCWNPPGGFQPGDGFQEGPPTNSLGYPLLPSETGSSWPLPPVPNPAQSQDYPVFPQPQTQVPQPTGVGLRPPFHPVAGAPYQNPYQSQPVFSPWRGPGQVAQAIAHSTQELRQNWEMPFGQPAPMFGVNVSHCNPYTRERLGISPDASQVWVPQPDGDPNTVSIFGTSLNQMFGSENVGGPVMPTAMPAASTQWGS